MVAVIGCVAAVVSAYKDGGRIVKSIKAKRTAKSAPAPTEPLELSLERGPLAVGEARDNGIDRYGPQFAKGDRTSDTLVSLPCWTDSTLAIATEALRDILITLQGTLLRHLWVASEDDNVTDFNMLVDASDFGRIKSVTVLNELYMRMAQAAPLQRPLLPPTGRIEIIDSDPRPNTSLPWEPSGSRLGDTVHDLTTQPPSVSGPDRTLHYHVSTPDLPSPDLSSKSPTPRKKWGLFSKSRKNSEDTESTTPIPALATNISANASTVHDRPPENSPLGITFGDAGHSILKTSSQGIRQPQSQTHQQSTNGSTSAGTWKPSPNMMIDEDNPWESEVSSSAALSDQNGETYEADSTFTSRKFSPPRRRSTEMTDITLVNESEPLMPNIKNTGAEKPSLLHPNLYPDASSHVESPSAAQDAKGALWKIPRMPRRRKTSDTAQNNEKLTPPQEQDKTPKASPTISRTQSSPQPSLSGSKNPYDGFCKCAYKLQVGLDKESVKIRNQSTSMTGQSNYFACASTKCAFEGPALSHGKTWAFDESVRVANAVQYRWTFLAKSHVAMSRVKKGQFDYLCVFCDRETEQPPAVYRSEKGFIEHVATHRGQHPATLLSDKVLCITGRVALEDEPFDINLTPRDETPRVQDQVFVSTPDLSSGTSTRVTTPEKEGVFQWPDIERLSGTSHWRNSAASRALQTLSS